MWVAPSLSVQFWAFAFQLDRRADIELFIPSAFYTHRGLNSTPVSAVSIIAALPFLLQCVCVIGGIFLFLFVFLLILAKSVKSVGFRPKCVKVTFAWKRSSTLSLSYRHVDAMRLGLGRGEIRDCLGIS